MNNWKVIFATAVIFGAGVITGGLLVNYVQHCAVVKPGRRTQPVASAASNTVTTNQASNKLQRPPEVLSKNFLQRLESELKLTPQQHEAIQKIINDGQNLIRKTLQDARLEIREVLTPAQREQFDELIKKPFRRPLFTTNNSPASISVTNPPAK